MIGRVLALYLQDILVRQGINGVELEQFPISFDCKTYPDAEASSTDPQSSERQILRSSCCGPTKPSLQEVCLFQALLSLDFSF